MEKPMRTSKRKTAILTEATLVSLMASSLVFAGAYTLIPNTKAGTVVTTASYLSSSNSADAITTAMYGDAEALLQYEWDEPLANGGESTGFYDGPAPDRPDLLY